MFGIVLCGFGWLCGYFELGEFGAMEFVMPLIWLFLYLGLFPWVCLSDLIVDLGFGFALCYIWICYLFSFCCLCMVIWICCLEYAFVDLFRDLR